MHIRPRMLLLSLALVLGCALRAETIPAKPLAPDEERTRLPPELATRRLPLESLHQDLSGSWLGPPRAYVGLYASGRLLGESWGEGRALEEALTHAWDEAARNSDTRPSHATVAIPTRIQAEHPAGMRAFFSTAHRGVLGALIESERGIFLLSPTQLIASNRSAESALKEEARRRGIDYQDWIGKARISSLTTRQFYVPLSGDRTAVETLRGNVLVGTAEVTRESVREFARLLTGWMFNNLGADGRLTYHYFPSTDREGNGNNMIRQWMGSVALGRAARLDQDAGSAQASHRNLRYNLEHFYRSEGELGFIEYRNEANLGAAALSMIALMESPRRAEFAEYERGLLATTRHLWQPSGRFRTFLVPRSRNDDNQNFYPGETLLAWSFLHAQNPDAGLLDMWHKSFAHYRAWHLQNRNPAFIPWHTQACYQLYLKTGDAALRDWIFEMNDWLIDVMQAHSRVAYDDTLGQFYEGTGNRYGPPHASATGAYLEGLIDAFTLARKVGDHARREKYRRSIILGLRSGMQLQFQDDIDMYYVANPGRTRGGMRTTVYDNRIRVDNVQHILMAAQKILAEFSAEDFRY